MRDWLPAAGSIAGRLFLSAAALSFPLLLVASFLLTEFYRRSELENFEQKLEGYLKKMGRDVESSAQEGREIAIELPEPRFELPLKGWYWQVTRTDVTPREIVTSHSLFTEQLQKLRPSSSGSELAGIHGGEVEGPAGDRLYMVQSRTNVRDAGVYLLQVAASLDEIEPRIERFRFILVGAFTLLGVALAAAAAVQVRVGLRPLRALREELGQIRRGAHDRIQGVYPTEVAPLVEELNLLMVANREIVERAKTQVGNLAHALKTPLSVIINEADAAPSPLSEKVSEQAQVMRHQVAYYLDRARAAARAGALGSSTRVAPALSALLRTFTKLYATRRIQFSLQASDALWFAGEPQDFDDMIGNLADNAGKWAREAVQVEATLVTTESEGRSALLVRIDDDGPGLPPELRIAATQRGRRLDETKPGSGLGLSIVADLAAAYGGSLHLTDSPSGGLRAELLLPGF
ncbi:MAG: ATP-binding protein [Methylocystis sp.]